eukprot:8313528-Alexandrium_andersonii.AAC.1
MFKHALFLPQQSLSARARWFQHVLALARCFWVQGMARARCPQGGFANHIVASGSASMLPCSICGPRRVRRPQHVIVAAPVRPRQAALV